MPAPRRKKLTLVEVLIILALLGIIFSMGAPKKGDGSRRSPTRATHARTSSHRSTEGLGNVIVQPESRRSRSPEAVPLRDQSIARTVRVLVLMVVITFVAVYLNRRARGQFRRPPQHRHPSGSDE